MGFLTVAIGTTAEVKASDAPRLSLPIDCKLGETCFIQSYVDVDPGPAVRDYMCGSATYQGHKGTDFRLNSISQSKAGVGVLAAANGIVRRMRDGMADALSISTRAKALRGRDCGNGVVIDHGDGWETQYCHMRQGTLLVRVGERVERGQRLGKVGYSGKAQFAHLHLSVRHNGVTIDPFSGRKQNAECATSSQVAETLWEGGLAKDLEYQNGQIFAAGFADAVPVLHALERDHLLPQPRSKSGKLILFARLMNLRKGDRLRLAIEGPEGFKVESEGKPLRRHKATYMAYAGKRRTLPSWPPGGYEGYVQVLRGGRVISEMRAAFVLPE